MFSFHPPDPEIGVIRLTVVTKFARIKKRMVLKGVMKILIVNLASAGTNSEIMPFVGTLRTQAKN